jgi:cytochrome c oxidase subunit II
MSLLSNASKLEQAVIGSTLIVLLFSFGMVVFSLTYFGIDVANCLTAMAPYERGEVIQHDEKHFEIRYVARMWSFDPPEVVVPPGAQVDIYLTSADVTHGLFVPGTTVNMMAVPGAVNYLRAKFDKAGVYGVVCHEYCGSAHQEMGAVIRVEPFGPKREQLEKEPSMPAGQKLLQTKGCIACHSSDGTPSTGPTFKGIYGRQEAMTDGTTITVDDAYLRAAIVQPAAKVVKGYQPIMPAFPLSDAELNEIVEYLKTVK